MHFLFADPYAHDLAKKLAPEVIKKAAVSLAALIGGDAQGRALEKCFERALNTALQSLETDSIAGTPEVIAEAGSVLEFMLSKEPVAKALVSAALTGRGDARSLVSFATEAGLDPTTLPFAWPEFLRLLLDALDTELHEAAAALGSPLWNRVALSEYRRLRGEVTKLVEVVEAWVGRTMAGFVQVDPAADFSEFLFAYLGRTDRPKPFGGRYHELQTLNDWVYEPGDKAKLLMVAPAGRGKSALLTHWVRQLPRDVSVIFVPVSLRYQSAQPRIFIPALAYALARLHGLSLDGSVKDNIDQCRAHATQLMRRNLPGGGQLVIVVDGLDEAGEQFRWSGLFPNELGDNVRILVAARQLALDPNSEQWMVRLGWADFPERVRPFALPGLDQDGVAEVLASMRLPPAAGETAGDLAKAIWRLSEGDPLLVGLYADDLWRRLHDMPDRPLRVDDLNARTPGLTAFFNVWWENQQALWRTKDPLQELECRTVLTVLAQALGPLFASELIEVAKRVTGNLNWFLRSSLTPLERFVIGDGACHGFALTHPRLNEFFGSVQFMDGDAARIRSCFTAWGEEVVERLRAGLLAPRSAPVYLVEHLGDHYEREGAALNVFRPLLDRTWAKAWEHVDPTNRGFLGDVQRTWDAAERASQTGDPILQRESLGDQLRCALCFGSLRAPLQPPSAPILIAAVETGELNARQILSLLADLCERSDFLERAELLAIALPASTAEALSALIDQAFTSFIKVRALLAVAVRLDGPARSLMIDKATRAARHCDGFDAWVSKVLLLRHMPERRREEEARWISAELGQYNPLRIDAGLFRYLMPALGTETVTWARKIVEKHFVYSALAPEPAARDAFDQLPADDQRHYIDRALDAPIADIVKSQGGNFVIVGHRLLAADQARLLEKLRDLPFATQLVVWSKCLPLKDGTLLPDMFNRILREIATRDGVVGELAHVEWRPILELFEADQRTCLARLLASAAKPEAGSGLWLELMSQVLWALPEEMRQRTVRAAIFDARRHMDECSVLESLGRTTDCLPPKRQAEARNLLAARIDTYLEKYPLGGDPRRTMLVQTLLPYMFQSTGAETSKVMFDTHMLNGRAPNISLFSTLAPFLEPGRRDHAVAAIVRWAEQASDPLTEASELWRAKELLAPATFEAAWRRMLVAADTEADPRLRALHLSRVISLLPRADAQNVAACILRLARDADEWEDTWLSALASVIPVADVSWLFDEYHPAIEAFQGRVKAEPLSSLLVALALRADGAIRSDILQTADERFSFAAWQVEVQATVLPALETAYQRSLCSDILRKHSDKGRPRQLRAFESLTPIIQGLDGEQAAFRAWEALWDVTAWWP
jgi:hypothetical protein